MKYIIICLGILLSLTSCEKEELEFICPNTGLSIEETESCVNVFYNYEWEATLIDTDIPWPTNTCLPSLPLVNTSYDYVYEVIVGYLPDPTGGIVMIPDDDLYYIFTNKAITFNGQIMLSYDITDLIVKQ